MFKSFDNEDEKICCTNASVITVPDSVCQTVASGVPSDKREHKMCCVI